ncbi:MAG TPA: thioredoxin family protein [Saprospiraceae bacterium]|nr:thioredoxin family protein [Saprospiraceae bacterium]HMP22758.1 thioredoxin family protein [Saprospiraceae bacterium]
MIKQLTFLLLLCPYWAAATPIEPIHFIEADLATVQQRAAREGKPYFVHFTANWCMPCRWMETHTFADAALAGYVNERYIAVQMDFDAKESAVCKQLYKVTALPSILVFNSAGELIDRRETSLEATELLKILFDNAAKNGVPIQNQALADRPVAMTVAYTSGKISRPALVPDEPSAPARTTVAANQPVVSAPRNAGKYAIQVGVYSDHSNAERNQALLQQRFRNQPVRIIEFGQNDKILYRVLIGAFETQTAADSYVTYLDNQSVRGFVKVIE